MRLGYRTARWQDLARAVKLEKAARERERWPRERLDAYRRDRIDAIVRHAVAHSPFHRERFAGLVGERPVDLRDLPPLDKATLMEHYDDVVTDRRLRRDELLAHAEGAGGDELYLGRYRVMATSGSSGRKGLFVYDRPDWSAVMAGFLRYSRLAGTGPRIPRVKLAYVGPSGGGHMSRRMASTLDVGLHRMHVLPATAPLGELVRDLQRIQPDVLAGFPSMVALLAEEQRAGRLRIAPRSVTTSSELRTPEMTATIREAWGVEPFDLYAATETGILGAECEHHRGIHLFDDLVALEVVDDDDRPVPDGEVGKRVLLTSFDNHVQPTIRLAVADMAAVDPEPCPCGRSLPLLRAVEGRTDDVLQLPGEDGRPIAVHPLQFTAVAQAREVREFQIVQRADGVRVRVVVHPGADEAALCGRLEGELATRLRALGVAAPRVDVEACDGIARDPANMGKLKLVVAA